MLISKKGLASDQYLAIGAVTSESLGSLRCFVALDRRCY